MSLPRRVRFEILRRDNHACRYCGAKAPRVELEVDHVIPRHHGGTDDRWNLTAAWQYPDDDPAFADLVQCDTCNWAVSEAFTAGVRRGA